MTLSLKTFINITALLMNSSVCLSKNKGLILTKSTWTSYD
ncbi:hypothetical protein HMPREF9096_00357 [Haemophilus sp. oral taxon 851 str. F0397]|nr:hypothetical protein HMPREF9096_00357 [Haemophilus sp. oral taxon 851 str. F0397]